MIIDIHGHYTTEPQALLTFRDKQLAGLADPMRKPATAELGTDYLPMMGDKWSDLSYSMPFFWWGDHAISDDSCEAEVGDEGELACGDVPFVLFTGSREDLPGFGGWAGSEIVSDDDGGDHSPDGAHDPDHDKFKGEAKPAGEK